jgi:site-specific DNA recombinase
MELNVEPAVNDTISLHPAVLARHEQQLLHLQDALSKGIDAGDSDAAEAIRELVETVTVFRDASRPGGITVEIAGRLNALLGEHAYPQGSRNVKDSSGRALHCITHYRCSPIIDAALFSYRRRAVGFHDLEVIPVASNRGHATTDTDIP